MLPTHRPTDRAYIATGLALEVFATGDELARWHAHVLVAPKSFVEDFVKYPENGRRYFSQWLTRLRRK